MLYGVLGFVLGALVAVTGLHQHVKSGLEKNPAVRECLMKWGQTEWGDI